MPGEAIGKTRAAAAKEKEKAKERLREAAKANMCSEKALQTQSKPEYEDMEDISYKPLGKTQANLSQLDVLRSQSSGSTDDAASTRAGPDISVSASSDSDHKLDLLEDFKSLSLNSGPSGVLDGFGGKGRSAFAILRGGLCNALIYHFMRTNAFNTQGFKNLLYHRITLSDYKNEKKEKIWLYTKENIQEIVGITIEIRSNTREYKHSPEALDPDNIRTGIKEEAEANTSLFVSSASPVTQIPPSNTTGQGSEEKQAQGPLRFSYNSFLKSMAKREKWHRLSEEDQERRLAEAGVRITAVAAHYVISGIQLREENGHSFRFDKMIVVIWGFSRPPAKRY
ncbi:hypothetical protein BO86DRAFT_384404 [Aspergillus japonicus CBS 114.51]|uniref:Uncharacterized protein n=1 Tax=Aspergillus japonicus CBS 114.51 TaxID=1448312 RepID=A0A8T8WJ79_ASPJA|nr:hypothetical protein BO86DRAFT_384404 [Aspergillus japonicus CBS 114.51]RAH75753.1 hypothetical protein BO86DRAFT_384404 [Aspergillus japonicus CBS 114.51]